ncbi:uncharacterized protein LOC110982516 [Acanthaster planci]|uniref:Uncharacterized protein LOC110982516 n=1 Tax=Acanthaster planci TaxID=133434 RepID=A0A8B7YTP3_ACAPL|nr:uncharacterized protein LOC110982516 [Acanthaster planci]
MNTTKAATVPTVTVAETTVPNGAGQNDVSVIITVAACIGGLFLVVLIIFIIFVIYFYRKQLKEDKLDKKSPSLRADRLDWKNHSLPQQFGDINEIDVMLWTNRGRKANDETNNPAYEKDFEPLDVNNLKAFESTDDDAGSTRETESSSDLVEINMDDEEDKPTANSDNIESTKQISILDMNTWGQPGSSRRNSLRSVHGFGSPPPFAPKSPDAVSNGRGSLRSQTGNPFPNMSFNGTSHNYNSQGAFPFTVSQPSNDPRFQYTRSNPLMADAMGMGANGLPFSRGSKRGYTAHEERDFGGQDDIQSVEFDRSSTLRGSRRNQSVVDFYESGTRTTGSSFSLALEGSGSIGKNLLWQNKKFGGMGFGNTK